MPGTAMHHMIAERLKALIRQKRGLGALSDEEYEQLNALLDDPKNQAYLYLGAQGPDFFFFNTRDWPQPFAWLLNILLDVVDKIDEIRTTILKLVPDEEVMEALGAADDTLEEHSSLYRVTKDRLEATQNLLNGLLKTLMEATKALGTDLVNPFNLLGHPYRDGIYKRLPLIGIVGDLDGEEWWTFDSLHYRKTGQFAKALLDRSDPSSPLHLYALGYLTHVAADTVGHSYVNLVSGGPYRSQPQRHRTGENFQDVFNYHLYASSPLKDLGRSQLHALYNFEFDGSVSPVDEFNPKPPPTGKFPEELDLPHDLGRFIADAIAAIYGVDQSDPSGPDFGVPISAQDVRESYRLWYKWWRSTTESGTIPAPQPYSFIAEVGEIVETLVNNLEGIGEALGEAAENAGNGGILGLIAFLAALIVAAVAAALAIADFLLASLISISTFKIRMLMAVMYEIVYSAYQNFRLMVALNGLALPINESLNEPSLEQFKNPSVLDTTNANADLMKPYMPLLRWHEGLNVPEGHLVYPWTHYHQADRSHHGEFERAAVAPDSYLGKHASFYAWGPLTTSPELMKTLVQFSTSGVGGDEETRLRETIWGENNWGKGAPLGNALTLSEWLYDWWQSGRPAPGQPSKNDLPDFNLDSDRGYGYLVWRQPGEDQNSPTWLPVQPKDGATPGDIAAGHEKRVEITFIAKDHVDERDS